MSKELEKLKKIQKVFEKLADWNGYDLSKLNEDFETDFDLDFADIESALKRLTKLEEEIIGHQENEHSFIEQIASYGPQLKALEIIKETLPIKEEDFFYDKETDTYFFIGYKVPKEKYDLLKEVLL